MNLLTLGIRMQHLGHFAQDVHNNALQKGEKHPNQEKTCSLVGNPVNYDKYFLKCILI